MKIIHQQVRVFRGPKFIGLSWWPVSMPRPHSIEVLPWGRTKILDVPDKCPRPKCPQPRAGTPSICPWDEAANNYIKACFCCPDCYEQCRMDS